MGHDSTEALVTSRSHLRPKGETMDEQSTSTLADGEILSVSGSETMPGDDDADGTDAADTDADDSDSDADDTDADTDGADAA
jgi:hypothetical protein